jgi:hypothetical protein
MNIVKTTHIQRGRLLAVLVACYAAVLGTCQPAVVYTDLSSFTATLAPGYYSTDFSSFTAGDQQTGSIPLSGGTPTYNFTIGAASGNLYVVNGTLPSGLAMSTASQGVDLVITFTSGNVTAVGADFFLTEVYESQTSGTLDIYLNDGTSVSNLVSPAYPGSVEFRGFTTTPGNYITSVTLHPDSQFITFDNLYAGTFVPEPATWIAAGLLGVVIVGRFGRSLVARSVTREK